MLAPVSADRRRSGSPRRRRAASARRGARNRPKNSRTAPAISAAVASGAASAGSSTGMRYSMAKSCSVTGQEASLVCADCQKTWATATRAGELDERKRDAIGERQHARDSARRGRCAGGRGHFLGHGHEVSILFIELVEADAGDQPVAEQADERADEVEHRFVGECACDGLLEAESRPQRIAERELGAAQQREADIVAVAARARCARPCGVQPLIRRSPPA